MQIFVVIWFILFFYIVGMGIIQFTKNESSPVLTVPAAIVNMRRMTHHSKNHLSHSYHVTFEMEGGERLELRVRWQDYKEFSIGDRGLLIYQGTRFQGFTM